ncbi:MAG TPA: hypothetical protein VNJ71_05575 [Gemmatimonadales bacterium]|jgi:hypothetical protein|nr:hypothetical protein [Gemmatimonadales bacterium]
MNAAHLHLVVNHLPVAGLLFGIALFAAARIRRSEDLARAALWTFFLTGVAGLGAYLTGSGAEETVEGLAGVSERLVERHEEAALLATAAAGVAGLIALTGLIGLRRGSAFPGWFNAAMLAGALVAGGLMARAANLGGQIRHPEIQGTALAGPGEEAGGGEHDTGGDADEDDD